MLRQLGGYQYRPATFAEALAVWDVVRGAVAQIGNFDHGYRQRPHASEPISPETMWLSPEYLAGELLTEPKGSPETIAARAEIALALYPDEADGYNPARWPSRAARNSRYFFPAKNTTCDNSGMAVASSFGDDNLPVVPTLLQINMHYATSL